METVPGIVFITLCFVAKPAYGQEPKPWEGECGVPSPTRIRLYSRNPDLPWSFRDVLPRHTRPFPEDIALANPWHISVRDRTGMHLGAATLVRAKPGYDYSDVAITSGVVCESIRFRYDRRPYLAVFGAHDTNRDGVQSVRIDTCSPHPDKRHWIDLNDIGVIVFKEPVSFSEVIQPACMPKGTEEDVTISPHPTLAKLPAWGQPGNRSSHQLRFIQLQALDRSHCNNFTRSPPESKDVFCVGAYGRKPDGGYVDTDCGGPVLKQINGTAVMIGVAILNHIRLTNPAFPTVVTNVSHFVDNNWIEDTIKRVSSLWYS